MLSSVSGVGAGTLVGDQGQVITVTRADPRACRLATDYSSNVLLAANTPRVEPLGLLVEPSGRNYTPYSSVFEHSNWRRDSNNGAITVTANSTDVTDPFGGNLADKIDLPAASSGYAYLSEFFATDVAARVPFTLWLRTLTGTKTIQTFMWFGGVGIYYSTWNVTSSWQRFSFTNDIAAGTAFNASFGYDSGAPGFPGYPAATVYAYGAQTERAYFPSSLIDNTDATVSSRTVEAASTPTTAAWPVTAGYASVDFTPLWSTSAGSVARTLISTVASGNGWALQITAGDKLRFATLNGAVEVDVDSTSALTWTRGTTYTCRVDFSGAGVTLTRDGVQVGTGTIAMPSSIGGTAYIGSYDATTQQCFGNLKALTVAG